MKLIPFNWLYKNKPVFFAALLVLAASLGVAVWVGGGTFPNSYHPDNCTSCHGPEGDVTDFTPVCYGCHNGSVPGAPSISGYYSGADMHGSAAGSGWGGTIKAPYSRGYPALDCVICHVPTTTDNAPPYLLKTVVNGKPLLGSYVDSNGYIYVMARARHDGTAPALSSGPTAGSLTYNSAAIAWTTNEGSTSWVDYGLTTGYGSNTGNGSYVTSHSVNLSGLTNHRTYNYRLTSADALGNAWVSGNYTFALNQAPPVPTLIDQPNSVADSTPYTVTLNWNAVTDPDGGTAEYQVQIDDVSSFASPNYTSAWQSGTSWAVSVARLVRPSSYYWQVRSRDASYPTAVSSWSSYDAFGVWPAQAPAAPTLVSPANGFYAGTTNPTYPMTFTWNAVTAPDGGGVEYQIIVDDDSNFASVNYDSNWISATTYSANVTKGFTYYWKVRAREAAYPSAVSGWSAVYSFTIGDAAAPSAPTLLSPGNSWSDSTSDVVYTVNFSWSSVTAPDSDACQYWVQISQDPAFPAGGLYAESGWLGTNSWSYTVGVGATYWWRVKARDAVHTTAESAWSSTFVFWIDSTAWSCPLVYVWNGKSYSYQTDVQGGVLGLPQLPAGRVKLYKEVYVKLPLLKPSKDGAYKIKMREAQREMDYIDQLKLLVVDHPKGTSVYDATSMNTNSFGYRTEPKIHTVKKSRLPKKAWDKDGNNILSLVKKVDNKPAPADKIADDYYIFDFGKIKDTANVKLLIDGWTAFGLTGMPANRTVLQPYVEVVDALGNWQKVQVLGIPAGDLKTVVVDLSGLFLHPEDHRIRLNTGLLKSGKFIVDRVSLDESPPAAVTTQLLTASSADLQHPGRPTFSSAKLNSRIHSQYDFLADVPEAYFYGAFTRLGEVKELLAATDDKFVVMRHGDELTVTFPAPAPPAQGYTRSVLLLADLYYKGGNSLSVDPLPFHAMSSYPYPAAESYPPDADHQAYLQNYNTRVYSKPAFPIQGLAADFGGSKITLAERILTAWDEAWNRGEILWQKTVGYVKTAAGKVKPKIMLASADFTPTHYSLNTNYVEIKVYDTGGSTYTYNISSANAEAWQSSTMPSVATPGTVATAGQKTAIASFDADRWTTSLVAADNAYNYQTYRFKITQNPGNLTQVAANWRGYGEPTAGYNVELYLWNFNNNSWENINSAFASTDTLISGSRSLTPMDRAGRGAEALCTACHQGNYHQGCMNCHNNGTDHLGTPTLCLRCHSHNGIRNFPDPQTTVRPSNPNAIGCHCHDDPWYDMEERDCTHCHGAWFPFSSVNDTTAPSLTGGPTASNVQGDRATISWSTNEASTSYVTYGATTSYGAKFGSAAMATSHSVTITGLTPAVTYHYRVRSADEVNNEMVSGDFTFTTYGANPPTTPVLIDEPDVYNPGAGASTVTLQWNASAGYGGHPVEYYVQVDDAGSFGSPNYVSGWQSGTSWTVTAAAPQIYYWRVQARDALFPSVISNWSSADTFTLRTAAAPPAPTLIAQPDGSIYDYWYNITLQWNPVTAPDSDPVEYYVQLSMDPNFGSTYAANGWTSALSWNLTVDAGPTYYWRVMARDAVHWTSASAWSAVDDFYIECTIPPPSSCPFVYVWDGEKYQYATDIQGNVLGMSKTNPIYVNKYFRLYGPLYVVLDSLVPDGDNLYRLKLREVQAEVDYFDEAKLLLVDYPAGYEIVSSTTENTYHFGYVNPFKIYTLKDARPPLAAFDQNGNDILAQVLAVDDNPAPAGIKAPEFYTFDFGPIAHPQNAKLALDGWTLYGKNAYAVVPDLPEDIAPYVELVDAQGQWQKVRAFGILAGDLKTMVVDLSGLFLSSDHRIRLNLGFSKNARTIIDRVRLDDSTPVEVTVTELSALSADLHYGGWATVDFANIAHRHRALDDVLPDNEAWYMYGAFTRYGEVSPLLLADDDKLALMRHGDELTLAFPNIAPPAYGLERKAVLKADVYYKSNKQSVMVEPLPYNAMEVYPPEPWLGPISPDYRQYLLDYNNRVYVQP